MQSISCFDNSPRMCFNIGVQMKQTCDICLQSLRANGQKSMWHRVGLLEAVVGRKL